MEAGNFPVTFNEMAINNFRHADELTSWIDFSQGCTQPSTVGCLVEPHSERFSLDDDCAFVLGADFPEVHGPQALAPQRLGADGGFASTSSADFLNALGGSEDVTPRMTAYTAPCQPYMEEEQCTVTADKKPGRGNTKAPRRAQTQRAGKKGTGKRAARGRAPAVPGPIVLLYKGTIGDRGFFKDQSMPWTLSLEKLNHHLAVMEGAWPEANS